MNSILQADFGIKKLYITIATNASSVTGGHTSSILKMICVIV